MPQTAKSKTLIAKWKPEQDCSVELPYTTYWSDGSPATSEDYLEHMLDTHTFSNNAGGLELRISPAIIADVYFDLVARQWVVSGDDVHPAALNITDRNAPDHFILAELATWLIVYRVRIRR
jgi:hypothetical protein